MQFIADLFAGYSIISAPVLILTALYYKQHPQPRLSRTAGLMLIVCLALIQWLNLQTLSGATQTIFSPLYIGLLYAIAPSFYLYSHQLLSAKNYCNPWQILHLLPVVLGYQFASQWAVPLAFVLGSLYLVWLARAIFLLRHQRLRFKLELLALACLFAIALAVIMLGFIWPLISHNTFVIYYSILIGLTFFITTLTLLIFPSITTDVVAAAQATYAESTLKKIDKPKTLERLKVLMHTEKLYTLETLSLNMLAEQLQLSSHQLSELINTEFQQGFSRYIRQYRIEAAKKLLIAEPQASILSIGLAVGFSTQSNFYSAFRDITGIAPGQFRKQQAN